MLGCKVCVIERGMTNLLGDLKKTEVKLIPNRAREDFSDEVIFLNCALKCERGSFMLSLKYF